MPPAREHADETEPRTDLPDAAPGLAEVAVGQARELVALGVAQHALEEVAVALLLLPTLVDDAARLAELLGEVVAEGLELGDAEQLRSTVDGRDADVDRGARERGDQRVAELALESLDLRPQRAAGRVVVATAVTGRALAGTGRRTTGRVTRDLLDVLDDDHGAMLLRGRA